MKLTWMGHAGHFICGRDCGFRLNTHVNGYIVSTVGELKYSGDPEARKWRPLGAGEDSLYETMVFRAVKDKYGCCPYQQESGECLGSKRYSTADDATAGHMAFLRKYSEVAPPEQEAQP